MTGVTNAADAACCSLSARGHVFAIECATDMLIFADVARQRNQKPITSLFFTLERTTAFATQLLDVAARFYQSPKVELPGHVIISIGLIDVLVHA